MFQKFNIVYLAFYLSSDYKGYQYNFNSRKVKIDEIAATLEQVKAQVGATPPIKTITTEEKSNWVCQIMRQSISEK
eukprot:Pgem_evm1s2434